MIIKFLCRQRESLPSALLHAHSEASPWVAGCVSKLRALRGGSSYLLGLLEPKLAWVFSSGLGWRFLFASTTLWTLQSLFLVSIWKSQRNYKVPVLQLHKLLVPVDKTPANNAVWQRGVKDPEEYVHTDIQSLHSIGEPIWIFLKTVFVFIGILFLDTTSRSTCGINKELSPLENHCYRGRG